MGLLSECQFCHQFFSTKGMAEHVRAKHGTDVRARTITVKTRASPDNASASKLRGHEANRNRNSSQANFGNRLTKAEQAQKVRHELQGRKNDATAAFIKRLAQQKANIEPLSSVWKEQVAKLSPLKAKVATRPSAKVRRQEHSYSLQLGRVPARNVPAPVTPSPTLVGESAKQALMPRPSSSVDVPCSCCGENERCFRCDGKGYYEVSEEKAARMGKLATSSPTPVRHGPVGFASDTRGAAYGLREQGRFASAPLHDDFGDDSSS